MTDQNAMHDPSPQRPDLPVWIPDERLRKWLLVAIVAVLVEGALQVVGTVLEIRFWNEEGLTPATAVGFVSILPQVILLAAWLTLARSVAHRGLWKSAAGFFACAGLAVLIDVATYGTLPSWLTIAFSVIGGIGILALMLLLFGNLPKLASANPQEFPAEAANTKTSGSPGCLGYAVMFAVMVALKFVIRRHRQWFAWLPDGVDSWAFFEMLVVGLLMFVFGVWFAVAKIRLRHKLGRMSAVLGGTELLVGALHIIVMTAGFAAVFAMLANDPEIGEAALDAQFNLWGQRALIAFGGLYCVWLAMTAAFFCNLRGRTGKRLPVRRVRNETRS